MPDYFEWAYKKAEDLRTGKDEIGSTGIYEAILEDARDVFDNACSGCRIIREMMDDAGLSDLFERKLASESDAINDIFRNLKEKGTDSTLFDAIDNINYDKLVANKEEKES